MVCCRNDFSSATYLVTPVETIEVGDVPVTEAVPAVSVPVALIVNTDTEPEALFEAYRNFPLFDTVSESGALPVANVPAIRVSLPVFALIL